MQVIGRMCEIEILKRFFCSQRSEFMAVYGRRRVGKTFLIKNYFQAVPGCVFFSATGVHKGSFATQRRNFCRRIGEVFYQQLSLVVPKDWYGVFELLQKAIAALPKQTRVVIFLDEFPWMVTPRSELLQVLEYYWNEYWGNNAQVKLIVCGSLASWIIKNLVNNTGGLYQRVTHRLKVEPFNLLQTKLFLKHKGLSLTDKQIATLYMSVGGIPLYLEQAEKGLTADQLIDKICFSQSGLLLNELHELFKSLFQQSAIYVQITREMAKHREGISKTDLVQRLKLSAGGRLTERLNELVEAGFVIAFVPYQHSTRGEFFKIIDEYVLFYFHWIEPNLSAIRTFEKPSGFWLEQTKLGAYHAWKGYAFESLCYKHLPQIMQKLSVKSTSFPYSWRYVAKKHQAEQGAQIDLLFDRTDDAITLCEIKYCADPFVIDKVYANNIVNKKEIFRKETKTKKQLFFAMISANSVKRNMYSEELLDGVVTLE